MSDENAVPEVATEVPAEATATVVESPVVASLSDRIAALAPDAQAVLQEVLGHVQDGFYNYSLGVGFSRLADLMK